MTCQACVNDIDKILKEFPGKSFSKEKSLVTETHYFIRKEIKKYNIDLDDQRVIVEGTSKFFVFVNI